MGTSIPHTYSLVLVVPCFNEESRLRCPEIAQWADRRPDWLWLLVDDGSSDGTRTMLESLQKHKPNIACLILPHNIGKAEAVRQGLLHADSHFEAPWLGYLDADFATSPAELERLFDLHKCGRFDFILGSRLRRLGATVEQSLVRHYLGRLGATLIGMMLRMPTNDTQCGAKLLRKSIIPILVNEPMVTRWLLDVELLARFRNHYGLQETLRRVIEEPLQCWREKVGSKLHFRELARIPGELCRLHWRYNTE